MKRAVVILSLAFVLLGQLFAVEKLYQAATITDIQQKTNTRVVYWVVNTPITKDEPYFEITVQLKDTSYLGRYMPRHANDSLPEEWKTGSAVEARIEGRHLFLKRPSGAEMQLVVLKKTAAKPGQVNSDPASAPK
jgi:hypothetical protein